MKKSMNRSCQFNSIQKHFSFLFIVITFIIKTRNLKRMAQYKSSLIDVECDPDELLYDVISHMECFNELHKELIDRTTNQHMSDWSRNNGSYEIEGSSHNNNFFFSPTSPLPFLAEDNHKHKDRQEFIRKQAICQRIDLKVEVMQNEDQLIESSIKKRRDLSDRSKQNMQSLKNLSLIVYKIVSQLLTTRYDQVVDRIISEMIRVSAVQNSNSKRQLNIKRRIYDILNVFIAVGIFAKSGKNVIYNQQYSIPPQIISYSGLKIKEKFELLAACKAKMLVLQSKREDLRKMKHKMDSFQKLLQKNKQKSQELDRINFPIIGVLVDNSFRSIYNKNHFTMSTNHPISLFGDLDLTIYTQQNSEQVPQELTQERNEAIQEVKQS